MKKKKLFMLIIAGILAAYIISALFIFWSASESIAIKFRLQYQSIAELDYEELATTQPESLLMQKAQRYGYVYPYVAALYDADGNLIARSGSIIQVTAFSGDECEEYVCFIDDWLTSEIKKQIVDWAGKNNFYTTGIDLALENDRVVPISITLRQFKYKDTEETFVFSDKKAQLSFNTNEPGYKNEPSFFISELWVDLDEGSYNHPLYRSLYENATSDIIKERIRNSGNATGGGASVGAYNCEAHRIFELNGKKYFLYEFLACRPVLETLTSSYFLGMIIYSAFFFAVLGAVVVFTANKIYNKNRRLEKARLAFTGAAAHELKTPLAVISNQCECILENVAPEKNGEYVRCVYNEALRMNRLVATLLQYNRLASSDAIIKKETDLSKIVTRETQKYLPLAEEKAVNTVCEIEENLMANCNGELIALVVDNFLSNAVKHTTENGQIKVSAKKVRHGISVSVFNQGDHIKSEDAAHIWDEFYREDKARSGDDNSTGMGLAICRQILELHEYKYSFCNKPGGVEFGFTVNK